MIEIVVLLFEGASMGVLMLFHCMNFRQGSLLSSRKEEEPQYASIMPGEYHFFPDEEVDAHSLADESSRDEAVDTKNDYDSELDSQDSDTST